MRYMIASALVLFGPTIGRILPNLLRLPDFLSQNIQYAVTYIVLVSLILYDRKNKKQYRPYLVAVAGFVIHQLVFYWVFL